MSLVHSDAVGVSVPTEGRPTAVAAILNAAADLLEKPGAWTQGDYARDDNGVGWDEAYAYYDEPRPFEPVCFCALGAINRARGAKLDATARGPEFDALRDVIEQGVINDWNDWPGRTQEEVVAALREAARKADAAERSNKLAGYEGEAGVNPTPATIQEER